jgi:hypothetical protein
MSALLAVMVLASTPTPDGGVGEAPSRVPLGVSKARPKPDREPLRATSVERATDASASSPEGASRQVGNTTEAAPVERTLVPERRRLTPDQIWNERPPKAAEPVALLSESRAMRFVGALVGGAVGFMVPLLLLPVADAPCLGGAAAFFGCPSVAHGSIGAASLVGSMGGAAAGFAIAGGPPSTGALVLGHLAGLLMSLVVGAVVTSVAGRTGLVGLSIPVLIASGALVAGSQAAALLLRDDALEGRPWLPSSAGRLALTSLTFVGVATAGGLLVGVGSMGSSTAVLVGGGLVAGLSLIASWAVHRALDGRGSFLAATLGLLGAGLVGAFGFSLVAVINNTPGFMTTDGARLRLGSVSAGIVGSVLVAALAVPLALEIGHGIEVTRANEKVAVSLSGAPVPGGAVGMVNARF